jgi:hypothetical protein
MLAKVSLEDQEEDGRIKLDLRTWAVGMGNGRNGLGLCSLVGFGVSGVEHFGSGTTLLVT